MKLLLSLVFGFTITANACAQHFEGKVVYQNDCKSKLPNVSDAQCNEMMGSRQEYFIKDGNYKTVSNGTSLIWQIYINEENKLYNKLAGSETIIWDDGGKAGEPVVKIVHNRDVVEVLGYRCDELILKSKNQTETFYFSSKLGVDASLYSRHLFGNWYDYLKVAKALPLKSIIETPQFTLTSVATEIKPMKLDDKEFQLPPNVKTEGNPN